MAISYIVGVPRSGKTYYAVYNIWKNFIFKPNNTFLSKTFKFFGNKQIHKNIDYKLCYTNINQFDFSKSDKLIKFDKDDFKKKISDLYFLYQSNVTDEQLVKKSIELNLNKVLIILDEAHNFLTNKPDNILVWWLTYHGHLYQDIILITQDLVSISPEYKKIAEFFYKSVPPMNRLTHKNFRYIQYASYRMYSKADVVGDFTIPSLQEVFNLYVSGQKNTQKSKVTKYIYIFVFLFFLCLYLLYDFYNSLVSDKVLKDTNSTNTKPTYQQFLNNKNQLSQPKKINIPNIDKKPTFLLKDKQIKIIDCFGNDCTIKENVITLKALNYLIKELNITILDKTYQGSNIKLYLLIQKDFDTLFQDKKVSNEKSTSSTAPKFNLFNSPKP
jgi:zona occludens toxin